MPGKLAEAGFEHVALLELFDLRLADFFLGQQAGGDAADQLQLAPQPKTLGGAAEGQADLTVDQLHRQLALACGGDGTLEFGAGLDLQLLSQAALIRGQRQVGCKQRDAPLADDLHQVHPCHRLRVFHRGQALPVQLDGDGIEPARANGRFHGGDTGR